MSKMLLAATATLAAPAILRAQTRPPIAKLGTLVNEEHPATVSLNRYAKAVGEKTNGEVRGIPDSTFSDSVKLGQILSQSTVCQECMVRQIALEIPASVTHCASQMIE
jgi:TRAP-type C4-dicarboxylate transport system substrate-binding protein